MSDARTQGWAHIVATAHVGATTATYIQDAGPGRGQQQIQIGPETAKVIVVDGMAYTQGNSEAVVNYFGFPAADGPTLAGRWISIPPSNPGYAMVAQGVSLASALDESGLKGHFSETAPTTRDGWAVIGIRGTASSADADGSPAVLYVSTTDHPLPVEFDATSSKGTEQAVFSYWNRPVPLSAPSGALPAAAISSS